MGNPGPPARSGREIILRAARRVLTVLLFATGVIYILDYGVLRYRIAVNRTPFGSVTVRPYYAVPQKNHSTEFLMGDPQAQTCVNSIFPHVGDSPCWYLTRHKDQRINM
ncbi:MAG: hypothetical protein M3Y24_08065 [Acidobacteriota bacterium]|nr:hypothetical protein [Acidobacteriota bacterium]